MTSQRPVPLAQLAELRYGENPWQGANFFTQHSDDPLELGKFMLELGEVPSATNLTDIDRGLRTITHVAAALQRNGSEFDCIALALKHGNCCGAAYGPTPQTALKRMVEGDLKAIMGATIVVNFYIDTDEANTVLFHRTGSPDSRRLIDVIVAPKFSTAAMQMFERKNGKCRVFSNLALSQLSSETLDDTLRCRSVRRGYLVQDGDSRVLAFDDPELKICGRPWHQGVLLDLAFASALCRTSNSNTVTLVRDCMFLGQGVGQTRRDRAARLAVDIAKENGHLGGGFLHRPLVACSDSFFPFADGVEPLITAGVKAIFATSGALRDEEVRDVCHKAGVTLYQLPDKQARMFFGH